MRLAQALDALWRTEREQPATVSGEICRLRSFGSGRNRTGTGFGEDRWPRMSSGSVLLAGPSAVGTGGSTDRSAAMESKYVHHSSDPEAGSHNWSL